MRLSELMSSMDLDIYPQIALVIFLTIFAGVVVRVCSRSAQKDFDEAARLPLSDDGDTA